MPIMNHKRRLDSHSTGIHAPNSKRCCLDEHTENTDVLKSANRQAVLLKMLPPFRPKLHLKGRTACMKELQPSAFFLREHSPLGPTKCACAASSLSNNDLTSSNISSRQVNGYKNEKMSPSVNEKNDGGIPAEDVESSFIRKSPISKSMTKQPAVLMKINQTPLSINPYQVSPEVSSVIFKGYVHRMASLNARACVAAFLEPERKASPKLTGQNGYNKPDRSRVKRNSKSNSSKLSLPATGDDSMTKPKAVVLNLSAIENAIPVIKLETNGLQIPACAVIVQGPNDHYHDEGAKVPYNKMGLLYNGDTLHPHAQVFLTQSRNNELELPSRVVPVLVPSRLSTVKKAAEKAAATGVLQYSKRRVKVNETGS